MICRVFYYVYDFIVSRFKKVVKPKITREDLGMDTQYINFQDDQTIIEDVYEIHNV
jgi:hypothetical protein